MPIISNLYKNNNKWEGRMMNENKPLYVATELRLQSEGGSWGWER